MLLSTRGLFVLVLLIALFTMASREVTDPDFWWHLRTGQYILETAQIPHVDIYSFTNTGKEWVAHEWLSEVLIYTVYRLVGWAGLIILFSLIITAAFAITFLRSAGRPFIAAFSVLLGAFATAPTWGVRPQMFSMLLASVFLSLLGYYLRGSSPRVLMWLVPLTVLWVNLHSGFAIGIALVGLVVLGVLLDGFVGPEPYARIWQRLRELGLVLIACLAVVPLNPNGVRIYLYPLETLTSRAMQTYIQEWFSPDFHAPEFQAFALLLLGCFVLLALSRLPVRPSEVLLLAVLGYAGLRSARNIPIFAIVAIPILAERVTKLISGHSWAKWVAATPPRAPGLLPAVNLTLLLVLLIASGIRVSQVIGNQPANEAAHFPGAAVSFIQDRRLPAPLYNSYGWGGYLIWKLYPAYRVFIDGRADVYGDTFIEEYLKVLRGGVGWREVLDRYAVRTVLIEPEAPLAGLLRQAPGWTIVFEDRQAAIFTRP